MDAVTDFLSGVDDSALSVNESVNDGYLETRCLIDDALSSWDSKAFAILQSGITKLGGIYKAALSADTSGIFRIVKKQGLDAPLNEADDNGCTPLMYAALSDSRSTIEMLLNFGVKREQTDSYGRTAVHYASFFGKSKALQFLIESGSDWTSRDIYGITPMHWACASKNIKCLSILLNYASAVNGDKDPEDFEGMTPAHCASKYDSFKHLTILYEANCNFLKTDVRGKTVLHWTADNSSTLLLEAIISNHPYLLNKKDNSGHSVLHLCAFKGNVVIIEYLLNTEGIDIDIRDKYDRTPLHLACIGGHSQVVQILLLYHALESCIDSFGLTPLHYAVNVKSLECVQELVATPYIKHAPSADERGITPLILAAEFGFLEILKILLSNPLIAQEVNYCDSSGYSGLHYATFGGFYDCVVCLLQYNCDPNLLDNSGASALDMACERQHFDCITAVS
jgi:ankyrin repeat protein